MLRLVPVAMASVLLAAVPAAAQDAVLPLSPLANVLYPATAPGDVERVSGGEVLQLEPSPGGLYFFTAERTSEQEYVGVGPLEHGLLLNDTEIVVTWVLAMPAGVMMTVSAEVLMGDVSLGTAAEARDSVANEATTYRLAFPPAVREIPAGVTPTLRITTQTVQPAAVVYSDLPQCSVELPIAALLDAAPPLPADNATGPEKTEDGAGPGVAIALGTVCVAGWLARRRRG